MTDFTYQWAKAKPGAKLNPPSPRFTRAVDEAFYWAEILDNGGSFRDFGEEPNPGTTAALEGFWRGRTKANNEEATSKRSGKSEEEKRKQRERYKDGP